MPVGLASDTITNGAVVVAPMYCSIGIDTESGSRMATALAVARMGREAWVRLVMLIRAATNGRIPEMSVLW